MRILVVEDDRRVADYLERGLRESGHVVDVARNGIDGRHLALEGQYDLVLLDVMLPGLDGVAALQAIRERSVVPVLMLTARDSVDDRVRGLRAGADDYLVKPFAFSELLARIEAVGRRSRVTNTFDDASHLRMADLDVDVLRRRATRAGVRLDLTAKEFTLLIVMMQRRGEVLSRTLLAELVWDMRFDSNTNVVDVAVRRLRSKLDDPFSAPLLHTVRGMGYVLEDRAP